MSFFAWFRQGKPEPPKVAHEPLPAVMMDPYAALTNLDSIGRRYGITNLIEDRTIKTLTNEEVVSIRPGQSAKLGLMAYSAAKILRSQRAEEFAQSIIGERVRWQAACAVDAAAHSTILIVADQAGVESISSANSRNVCTEIAKSIQALADYYTEAGSSKAGLVVAEEFAAKYLQPGQKPKLYVLGERNNEIGLNITHTISEAAVEKLCQLIGSEYRSYTRPSVGLAIQWDSRGSTVRITLTAGDIIGMEPVKHPTMYIMPDGTFVQPEKEQAVFGHLSESIWNYVSRNGATFAGDTSQQFNLGTLIPGIAYPWSSNQLFAFAIHQDGLSNMLVVAYLGDKPLNKV